MKLQCARENLLAPLQKVIGVIERRNTLPILANVLMEVDETGEVALTGTDMEMQLVARDRVEATRPGAVTLPARKLHDLLRLLPDGSALSLDFGENRCVLRAGGSRYALGTLPAAEFPRFDAGGVEVSFLAPAQSLRRAVSKAAFCIAQQDVRYYLCGMLLEACDGMLRAVASDGHRLAVCELEAAIVDLPAFQVILPRKGVVELQKLLADTDGELLVEISPSSLSVRNAGLSLAVKLISAKYPDYRKVIPTHIGAVLEVDKEALKASLTRVSVLSDEKLKAIKLEVAPGGMVLSSHGREAEEAEERIDLDYTGERFVVGFNAVYLLDALASVDGGSVSLGFSVETQACLVGMPGSEKFKAVVMPLRL